MVYRAGRVVREGAALPRPRESVRRACSAGQQPLTWRPFTCLSACRLAHTHKVDLLVLDMLEAMRNGRTGMIALVCGAQPRKHFPKMLREAQARVQKIHGAGSFTLEIRDTVHPSNRFMSAEQGRALDAAISLAFGKPTNLFERHADDGAFTDHVEYARLQKLVKGLCSMAGPEELTQLKRLANVLRAENYESMLEVRSSRGEGRGLML